LQKQHDDHDGQHDTHGTGCRDGPQRDILAAERGDCDRERLGIDAGQDQGKQELASRAIDWAGIKYVFRVISKNVYRIIVLNVSLLDAKNAYINDIKNVQ